MALEKIKAIEKQLSPEEYDQRETYGYGIENIIGGGPINNIFLLSTEDLKRLYEWVDAHK